MTDLPTPARWTDPGWLATATGWAADRLAERGTRVVGRTHPHVRPWSTVLRLETTDGVVWLKAPGDGARAEVALLAVLAELDVPHTPRPVAHDVDLGLLLLPDAGPVSRTVHGGATPPDVMADHLGAYAGLQRSLEPHADRLVGLGVEDLRPALMPQVLAETIERLRVERPPGRLDDDDAQALVALLPAYAEACAELAAGGVRPTLQHDDLHDNNIAVPGPVFLDWGDACVGHPFGTLLATLRSVMHHHGLGPDDPALHRIADAYTEAWTDVAPRPQLRRWALLALRVGPLTRSLSYRRALTGVEESAWAEDGDALPGWLLELLEPGLPLRPPLLAAGVAR